MPRLPRAPVLASGGSLRLAPSTSASPRSSLAVAFGWSRRGAPMTRGEHERIIGFPAVRVEDVFGNRHGGQGEIDVGNVVFEDAVGRDDEEGAGTDRHLVCGPG